MWRTAFAKSRGWWPWSEISRWDLHNFGSSFLRIYMWVGDWCKIHRMSHTRISIENIRKWGLCFSSIDDFRIFFKRVDNSQLSNVRLRSAKGQTSSRAGEHLWGVASVVAERWSHGDTWWYDAKGFNFYFGIGMILAWLLDCIGVIGVIPDCLRQLLLIADHIFWTVDFSARGVVCVTASHQPSGLLGRLDCGSLMSCLRLMDSNKFESVFTVST